MCGLSAFFSSPDSHFTEPDIADAMAKSLALIKHRGPDDSNINTFSNNRVVLGHVRLSIIDLDSGAQPFTDSTGRYTIVFNGELYNYKEVRSLLSLDCRTCSDTEVVLQSFILLGEECLKHFTGMFAFVIWDNVENSGFVARDRFGIKPLYFNQSPSGLSLCSEIKGLLPFIDSPSPCSIGLADYFNFQFTLSSRTLFSSVYEFPAAHYAIISNGQLGSPSKYWTLSYNIDYTHTESWFIEQLRELLQESVSLHCTSDVPVASYVSGGIDSTLISSLSLQHRGTDFPKAFTGRYISHEGFDESKYAIDACKQQGIESRIVTIKPDDFVDSFESLIWHLDQPSAGPGSFGQYIVSRDASKHCKVILGGQGGDEIFGGYTRYLICYFEQCIKGAIDGTLHDGNYVVTYESIISNLATLRQYKPMLKQFWANGLFDSPDKRYWNLINRSNSFSNIIEPLALDSSSALSSFNDIFYADGTEHASYFDRMSHFDFRSLLPALLHVEDRVSMAHGLESRVPFLDHHLVEFVATIPADIKFKNGELKRLLPLAFNSHLPRSIIERKDKMGFPIPLNSWIQENNRVREYVGDILSSSCAQQRPYLARPIPIDDLLSNQGVYGRALWALLCLEVWHRLFIDS